jgi:hypothetical protein
MSLSSGMPLFDSCFFPTIKPPRTTVCPAGTVAVVKISRVEIRGTVRSPPFQFPGQKVSIHAVIGFSEREVGDGVVRGALDARRFLWRSAPHFGYSQEGARSVPWARDNAQTPTLGTLDPQSLSFTLYGKLNWNRPPRAPMNHLPTNPRPQTK